MIRVDYAGPGGSCEGIRSLGLESVGFEYDAAACRTRAAAGHLTIRADLAHYRTPARFTGYWASPPCQAFSTAGKGDGREQIDDLAAVIHAGDWSAAERFDDRTRHVIDACRTAEELHPEWVAFEQVPAVLPLWRAFAHRLRARGYSTWTGILCAADYGVPQTRRRAILMASRVRPVAPPPPTHAETPGLFGERPWIGWGEALNVPESMVAVGRRGAGMTERHGERPPTPASEPYPVVTTGPHRRHWLIDRRQTEAPVVTADRPAPTLTSAAGAKGVWVMREVQANGARRHPNQPAMTITASADNGNFMIERIGASDRYRLTVAGALALQGFPTGYPVQGTQSERHGQIGNAVPPPLAAAVVAALTGTDSQPGAIP